MSEGHKDNVIADLHEQVRGWRDSTKQAESRIHQLEGENAQLRKRLAVREGTCGCREWCGDLPEGEDAADAVCKNLPRPALRHLEPPE